MYMYMARSKSNEIVSISYNANEIQIFKMKFVNFHRFAIFMQNFIELSLVTTEISSRQKDEISMSRWMGINFDKEFLIALLSNVRFCYHLVQ